MSVEKNCESLASLKLKIWTLLQSVRDEKWNSAWLCFSFESQIDNFDLIDQIDKFSSTTATTYENEVFDKLVSFQVLLISLKPSRCRDVKFLNFWKIKFLNFSFRSPSPNLEQKVPKTPSSLRQKMNSFKTASPFQSPRLFGLSKTPSKTKLSLKHKTPSKAELDARVRNLKIPASRFSDPSNRHVTKTEI